MTKRYALNVFTLFFWVKNFTRNWFWFFVVHWRKRKKNTRSNLDIFLWLGQKNLENEHFYSFGFSILSCLYLALSLCRIVSVRHTKVSFVLHLIYTVSGKNSWKAEIRTFWSLDEVLWMSFCCFLWAEASKVLHNVCWAGRLRFFATF